MKRRRASLLWLTAKLEMSDGGESKTTSIEISVFNKTGIIRLTAFSRKEKKKYP